MRSIIQRLDDTGKEMYQAWRKIGLKVRYYPDLEARIFIIDKRIIYFTSYDSSNKKEAVGIRAIYPPFAKLMEELFEKKWKVAKEVV